jgi:hypothetical protein
MDTATTIRARLEHLRRLARRPALLFAAVFLVALWRRWDFALTEHPPELYVVADMAIYLERGRALLERPRVAWDLFTPVGYPAWLALCERLAPGDLRFVAGAQAVLGALVAPSAAWLADRLGGRLAGWLAGLGVALYFPLVLYTGFLLSETLFSLLLTLAAALAVHGLSAASKPAALAGGAVFALACVVRPSLLALLPILLVWMTVTSDLAARRAIALLLGAWQLVMAPLAVHHSLLRGAPTLLATNGGVNFYLARSDCRAVRSSAGGALVEVSTHFNRTRFERTCVVDARLDDEAFFYREGLRFVAHDPATLWRSLEALGEGLGLAPRRAWPHQPFWPGSMLHDDQIDRYSRGFFWFGFLPALGGASVLGARARRGEARAKAGLVVLGGVLLSVLAVLAVYNGNPRVRVSSDALVIVLVAVGVACCLERAARSLRTTEARARLRSRRGE